MFHQQQPKRIHFHFWQLGTILLELICFTALLFTASCHHQDENLVKLINVLYYSLVHHFLICLQRVRVGLETLPLIMTICFLITYWYIYYVYLCLIFLGYLIKRFIENLILKVYLFVLFWPHFNKNTLGGIALNWWPPTGPPIHSSGWYHSYPQNRSLY